VPGPIRMNMFFSQNVQGGRSNGWSETHYSASATTLSASLTNLILLAQARVQMLGAGVQLTYMRVSDDAVFRDVQPGQGLFALEGPKGPYYNSAFSAINSDFSDKVAVIRCVGNQDFYNRSLYLSGNPDSSQEISFDFPALPAWNTAYDAWKVVMLNGRFGFKVLDQSGANPRTQVINLVAGVFTTALPHGLLPNEAVRISAFRPSGPPLPAGNPNGRWYVSVINANSFSLLGYNQGGFSPTRMGVVRAFRYVVTPYTRVFFRYFGLHKRGRPFGQPRGRSPRRARS
jgi:hypothetical protein